MMAFSVPARFPYVLSALLVILLTQRVVLVCPSSGFALGSHSFVPPLPALAYSLLSALRFRCLFSRALTASISIGRGLPAR